MIEILIVVIVLLITVIVIVAFKYKGARSANQVLIARRAETDAVIAAYDKDIQAEIRGDGVQEMSIHRLRKMKKAHYKVCREINLVILKEEKKEHRNAKSNKAV